MKNTRISGSTLLESLIAVVVLSVGLLGIAMLQLQSKHLSTQEIQRSGASLLTNEIVERMRNNNDRLSDYFTTVGGGTINAAPSPDCSSASNPCIVQEIASYDLWQWEQAIDGASESLNGQNTGGLSLATGCITGPAGGGTGMYTVSVAWRGQSLATNVNTNSCGQSSGNYDDNAGDNAYRRLLAIDVYIAS
jgi:type IV pilus assembly protein PilV